MIDSNDRRRNYMTKSTGDGDLDLDTGLQADGGLNMQSVTGNLEDKPEMTYDLLHDLRRGVEVNETLVDLELVAIPGL